MPQFQSANLSFQTGRLRRTGFAATVALVLGFGAAVAEEGSITVELNKLEPKDKSCRVYLVINNKSATDYQDFNLDLVLFRPDGIVARNFKINLGPLKADKRTVKLFDLDNEGTGCDQVGSFLVNDVLECNTATGPAEDCLGKLTVSSVTKVQLSK